MGNSVKSLKKLIDECCDTNRHEWPDEARTILEAVGRISKPTKLKLGRTIADAILKKIVIPSIAHSGWSLRPAQTGNLACDLLLERDSQQARVEVVLLQRATAKFKRIYRGQHSVSAYALKLQKRHRQTKAVKGTASEEAHQSAQTDSAHGRSYSFGEFDILAVNIHAATNRWPDFRYTLSNRLRPEPGLPSLINAVQSVSLEPNEVWTDDLDICLEGFSRMN